MNKQIKNSKIKILIAITTSLALGLFVGKSNDSNFFNTNTVVQAAHVKGNLGKLTTPKKMRGTWYGKAFDMNYKSNTIDKLRVKAHKIGSDELHRQDTNAKGIKNTTQTRNWVRAFYPVTFKKDKNIKYISMFPWSSPVASGRSLGLYHYKGHRVLIERTLSSYRITNVYWRSAKLARMYGGTKPKELKTFAQW